MAETRADVFANCAGLLRRMGFVARAEASYIPIGETRPRPALVTDCPEMLVGFAVAMVAEDPSASLPTRSARVPKAKLQAGFDLAELRIQFSRLSDHGGSHDQPQIAGAADLILNLASALFQKLNELFPAGAAEQLVSDTDLRGLVQTLHPLDQFDHQRGRVFQPVIWGQDPLIIVLFGDSGGARMPF